MRWEFKRLFIRAKKNFGKAFAQLFDDAKDAIRELLVQIPRDIKIFLENLKAYSSHLWYDRDYDYSHILRLLQLKIRRTKEHIGDHKLHTRWKLDVKDMQKAEDMIKTILDNDFGKELREAHDAKWGPSMHYSVPVVGSTSSYMRTDRPNIHNSKDKDQERKEYRVMMKREMKLEQKAWSGLWKHLDKNLRNWWD